MLNIDAHQFVSTSTSRGGINTKSAACSCGYAYDWYGREAEHEQHVLAEVWAAGAQHGLTAADRGGIADDQLHLLVNPYRNE